MATELQDKNPPTITPVNAVPSAELTAAQRRKRYEELRQRLGKPRLEVKGLSNRHYFWAHKTDSNEMDRLDVLGYKITREPNAKEVLAGTKKPIIQAAGLREDGTYCLGDVILMDCDAEVYEFIMLDNDRRSDEQVEGGKSAFQFEAEKSGVPTFEVDRARK